MEKAIEIRDKRVGLIIWTLCLLLMIHSITFILLVDALTRVRMMELELEDAQHAKGVLIEYHQMIQKYEAAIRDFVTAIGGGDKRWRTQ